MQLRLGNLVRHKSGGPIMIVDFVSPHEEGADPQIGCYWIENGARKSAYLRLWTLQAVHADGSPRNYDDES